METENRISQYKRMIISFYLVGLVGILIPFTSDFFISITPFALIFSFILLIIAHNDFNFKTIIGFTFVFVGGIIIEIIGVNTGTLFGDYQYGHTLGPKIAGTPWIMGLNWILIVYLTYVVAHYFKTTRWMQILIASVLMVIYDFVLEKCAPGLDMWSWNNHVVPLQNYFAWFIFALIFQFAFSILKISAENKLAIILLLSQFIFFGILAFKFQL